MAPSITTIMTVVTVIDNANEAAGPPSRWTNSDAATNAAARTGKTIVGHGILVCAAIAMQVLVMQVSVKQVSVERRNQTADILSWHCTHLSCLRNQTLGRSTSPRSSIRETSGRKTTRGKHERIRAHRHVADRPDRLRLHQQLSF